MSTPFEKSSYPFPAKPHPTNPDIMILTHHFATDRKTRLAGYTVLREVGPETHILRQAEEEEETEP